MAKPLNGKLSIEDQSFPMDSPPTLASQLKVEARSAGFDLVGIAPAVSPMGFHDFLDWLDRGHAGGMAYLGNRREAYEHPRNVLETVRSVVMLGVNYFDQDVETERPGRVARYAHGPADYHDVLRERLKRLGDWLHDHVPDCRTRGVVDTAPLLERDFARLAGLGWFGKNTMLINKRIGSWTFLAALLTDVELEYDAPHDAAHCGTCTRCLEACPTDAFPEPHVLDASKCISYLTIELRDQLPPPELREGIGDWLFGCDICQDVCPWNRKAPTTTDPAFASDATSAIGSTLDPIALLALDEAAFRERFRHTPLARPKRAGLLRNACLVLGNSGDRSAVGSLIGALGHAEPLIRGAAAWALGRLGGEAARAALQDREPVESDGGVREEIVAALASVNGSREDACHD